MSFANATDFSGVPVPYVAPDGRDVVIALVKATYFRGTDGTLHLAGEQSPVRLADLPQDPEAEASSIRYPSDVGMEKRGTDVVVVGDAVSRAPVEVVDVGVRVGERTVPLRVHGIRMFYQSAMGRLSISPAAPFERKAIVYEDAYGGTSEDFCVVERRNPVGRGVAARDADLIDQPAPSIEHPAHPITSASKSDPVGFGAIGSHWEPRCGHAGTYDEPWLKTRMPLLPLDFDHRYFNVAHPSLQFGEPLEPGELLAIVGMTLDEAWQIELPRVPLVVRGKRDDGQVATARPPIDTVLIDVEADRLELTLRHSFSMGRGKTLLREIQVDTDG